jgi:Cu/Ag efflux pump CusA
MHDTPARSPYKRNRDVHAITDPAISLTKAAEILREQDRIIAEDPDVASVVGKIGRADTATDPARST